MMTTMTMTMTTMTMTMTTMTTMTMMTTMMIINVSLIQLVPSLNPDAEWRELKMIKDVLLDADRFAHKDSARGIAI